MTHAVMRGSPTKAQLYMETVIRELVAETGREEDRYCVGKILFKCLRDHPDDVRQIEGASGKTETNQDVLERSVRTARALQHAGLVPGCTVITISRNHPEMCCVYLGTIFSGVVPFPLHVSITVYELKHFIGLSDPRVIFTESAYLSVAEQALAETGCKARIIVFGEESYGHTAYNSFISDFGGNENQFRPISTDRDAPVLIKSTSGSTGFPKAAVLSTQGLVAQLPTFWATYSKFPTPTRLMLVLSNAHWISYTMSVTTAIAFNIPVLFTVDAVTIENVRCLLRKYRPSFFATTAAMAQHLTNASGYQPDDLKSIEYLCIAGTSVAESVLLSLHNKIHPDGKLINGYGTTETHGGAVAPTSTEPLTSIGRVVNIFDYKIIDELGNALGPNQPGELCLKAQFKFKGYLKDEELSRNAFTEDGYFRTGDKVYMNEEGEFFFVDRLKFLIKYKNFHISPAEIENIISRLDGVISVAVCEGEKGPAAMVALKPGAQLTPTQIHEAVNGILSNEKRLRGGVTLVSCIPLSVNGKIDRKAVKMQFDLVDSKDIYYYD